MNQEQYTAIAKQAQAQFDCTQAQAMRLARSFATDTGESGGMVIGEVAGELGLATILFPNFGESGDMSIAIRLVRLLQRMEAMEKEGLMDVRKRFELTPEMDGWLRHGPASPAESAEPAKAINFPTTEKAPRVASIFDGRCRLCGKHSMPGADVCYTCNTE
jgi:hypothetical protein